MSIPIINSRWKGKGTVNDKIWRIQNLYKIRTKDRKIKLFQPTPIQWSIIKDVQKQSVIKDITLKARQVGLSTFWLIWWLDDCLFRPGTRTGVIAHKKESLNHLMGIIKTALFGIPRAENHIQENNISSVSFKNKSQIIVSLEIRSTTLHNLHISEWMLCDNNRIWATQGATSKYTNISGESTGNGIGNDGYQTYMDAKDGLNDFHWRFIPWFADKDYSLPLNGMNPYRPDKRELKFGLNQEQINFRRKQIRKLKRAFFIEYPEQEEDAFAQSGTLFFNNKKILALVREAKDVPIIEETNEYRIWEKPEPGHIYVIGADVAEGGSGGDYSAFKVRCVTCRREAMSFRAHQRIDTYYRELNKWGRSYNNALLGVELNNHGHAVILGLKDDCHYPNLFRENTTTRNKIIGSGPQKEIKYGWRTTAVTKVRMLQDLKIAIEGEAEEDEENFQPDFVVNDLTFLSECLTFQQDGDKLNAISGKFDDTVIAGAIANQMAMRIRRNRGAGQVLIGAGRESHI